MSTASLLRHAFCGSRLAGHASAFRSRAWQPAKKKSRRTSSSIWVSWIMSAFALKLLALSVSGALSARWSPQLPGAGRACRPPSSVVRRAIDRVAPLWGWVARHCPRGRSSRCGAHSRGGITSGCTRRCRASVVYEQPAVNCLSSRLSKVSASSQRSSTLRASVHTRTRRSWAQFTTG